MAGGVFPNPASEPKPVTFTCTLTRAQAIALAQLCKRIGWSDCKELSSHEDELYGMLNATDRVRSALEDAGVYVR